jgi:xylan 1,4-beta-xylosidase
LFLSFKATTRIPDLRVIFILRFFASAAFAQKPIAKPITIRVDASRTVAPLNPVWSYFGYDEPNYTYAKDGSKLIRELAALSRTPVHIRTHHLLTTGDGTPALKFGSTNAYTQDAIGNPIYDWTIVDKILETYLRAGAEPFVEIGFMPQALSSRPEPYVPVWKPGEKFDRYYLGWSYPPASYPKWAELIFQLVKHCAEKYGAAEAASWNWEVWNEPNISYWHGTPQEYDELYDYTAAAVKRALPAARVGGPASTGPANPKAAAFLRQFLEHCASGRNEATGATGSPLDFISFHAKGRPEVVDQHVRMGISQELQDVSHGFDIVRSFPKFRSLPIVLSEADPEGCAACPARVYPPNAYRNGTLYPAYTAAAMKALLQLAARDHMNLEGMLTWAFEFEGQPYFAGFRSLATRGIDKPILNLFRMTGRMSGDRIQVESQGAVSLDSLLAGGVPARPDIDALAARSAHKVSVLVWNYQDDDVPAPAIDIDLIFSGLPQNARGLLLTHYRIDREHGNAFTVWQRMGSPQNPSARAYSKLEAAGQLQLLAPPRRMSSLAGPANLRFSLPSQGISLLELKW